MISHMMFLLMSLVHWLVTSIYLKKFMTGLTSQ
jgi:hypothetical protein